MQPQYNNIVQRVLDTKNSAEKTAHILAPQQINDKYKHAYLSCKEAQKGNIEAATIAVGGLYMLVKCTFTILIIKLKYY